MSVSRILSVLISGAILVASCRKENTDLFLSSGVNADTAWADAGAAPGKQLSAFLDTLQTQPLVSSVANIAKAQEVPFGSNITLVIPDNGFIQAGGTAISGQASIRMLYLDAPGEFLRHDISMVYNGHPLKTLCAMQVTTTQGGKELQLAGGKDLYVMVRNVDADPLLKLFSPVAGTSPTSWQPLQNGSGLSYQYTQKSYALLLKKMQWVQVARLADTAATTQLTASLPYDFTNANTKIFIALKDRKGLVEMQANPRNKYFYAPKIPLQAPAVMVSVTAMNNAYYMDAQELTVTEKQHVKMVPRKMPLADILRFIDSL